MNPPNQRMRVGTWVRLELSALGTFVGFTYVDAQAGFSAQGHVTKDGALDPERTIIRLPLGVPWEELTAEEIAAQKLDNPPAWVAEFYGPQPPAGTEWGWWQDYPKLKGRFHPEYPDDLQVIVHDGGPRLSKSPPELMWVRVTGGADDVFTGRLLNQPHHLTSVKLGDEVRFVIAGGQYPVRVTERYLAERPDWAVTPCNRCGLGELFDPPSDLMRVVFPNTPAGQMQAFTAFCGACGGVQLVKSRQIEAIEGGLVSPSAQKKWWQFWK